MKKETWSYVFRMWEPKASYLQALANLQSAKSSYQIVKTIVNSRELYEKALVSHLEYVNYENSYVAQRTV